MVKKSIFHGDHELVLLGELLRIFENESTPEYENSRTRC